MHLCPEWELQMQCEAIDALGVQNEAVTLNRLPSQGDLCAAAGCTAAGADKQQQRAGAADRAAAHALRCLPPQA